MTHPIRRILILAVAAGLLVIPRPVQAETITLDGSSLGLGTVALVARDVSVKVAIDTIASERVDAGFDIVIAAAAQACQSTA